MSAEITKLPSKKSQVQLEARELLLRLAEEGYESVVIVGIYPTGKVNFRCSRQLCALTTIGAIEHAKTQVQAQWDDAL